MTDVVACWHYSVSLLVFNNISKNISICMYVLSIIMWQIYVTLKSSFSIYERGSFWIKDLYEMLKFIHYQKNMNLSFRNVYCNSLLVQKKTTGNKNGNYWILQCFETLSARQRSFVFSISRYCVIRIGYCR